MIILRLYEIKIQYDSFSNDLSIRSNLSQVTWADTREVHMVTGGGPGGSTWLRSLSPVLKASGALTRAGAAEWQGLACVTACVRLLRREIE